MPIPETPEALWEQIDLQRKALGDALTGNQKDEVHRTGGYARGAREGLARQIPEFERAKEQIDSP